MTDAAERANVGFSPVVIVMIHPFRPKTTGKRRGALLPLWQHSRPFPLIEYAHRAQTPFPFYLWGIHRTVTPEMGNFCRLRLAESVAVRCVYLAS